MHERTVRARTATGIVEGFTRDGVHRWRSIPYARAPVGSLRFRAPQPAQPWPGVRHCHTFANCAPQQRRYTVMGIGRYQTRSEDCLTLNVVTPEEPATQPLPVMVFIHGGGYILGSSATPIYDGAALARRGCVYVSVNYRLGALGCLDLSSLSTPQITLDSNVYLRDLVLALRWVHDNIAEFGGDPGNVTIFGESAGAHITATLLAVPAAKGLFARAISESPAAGMVRSREVAAEFAARFDALTFFFAANPDELRPRMRVVNEFQRRYPDIKVRALLSGPGVMQQLATFCAGGKCPDVLMAWELTYAELADRGVLLDLNTLLARDQAFAAELKSDSIGALYETFTFNGGQYAFPEQWSGNFLFYNKQLFDDAGVPPPPGSWERPWSFAEFLDAAQALTKQGRSGRDRQWGFVNAWVSFYAAGLFAMNNGVPWSVPRMNPTHLNFDHDGFLEAVQFYADLTNKHKVAPSAAEQQSMSTADLFSVGKAGIALAGHWRYQTFDRADGLDFDVAPLPIGPRGRAACSDIGVTGLAIAATSRRKDQAWEFVKFATGPVGQALIGESRLFVPVLRSAINSHGFANAHRRVGNLAVLSEGPAYSEGLPVTPAWEKIAALMDRYFGPVLRGSRPATSLTGLSQAVDEVLRNP